MKKQVLLILFALGFFAFAGAQTLEFSQVKLVTTLETVPAGKVWKVESVVYNIPHNTSGYSSSSSASCSAGTFYSYGIEVAGIPTKVGQGSLPNSASTTYITSSTALPIWLPAGTTLSGGPCNNMVSVIEFTVVP